MEDLLRRLRDSDPSVRREAIIALGRSKNPAALRALAEVYRTDPEPELRELARKAGQYIQQQSAQQASSSAPPSTPASPAPAEPASTPPAADPPRPASRSLSGIIRERAGESASRSESNEPAMTYTPYSKLYGDETEEEDEAPAKSWQELREADMQASAKEKGRRKKEEPPPKDEGEVYDPATGPVRGHTYRVSPQKAERAKFYMEMALSQNMSGDNAKAMKSLVQALSLNPNLINDSYYASVAGAVTGVGADEALQMVLDNSQRQVFVKEAEKQKRTERTIKQLKEARKSTYEGVAFELIIFFIVIVGGTMIVQVVSTEMLRTALLTGLPPEAGGIPANTLLEFQSLLAPNFAVSFLAAVMTGIISLISLFIQTQLIHLIIGRLGGVGTYPHLLTTLLRFYNKYFALYYVVAAGGVIVIFLTLGSIIPLCVAPIFLIFNLYILGKTTSLIGKAYDVSGAIGCVSLILSSIVMALVAFGIAYVLIQAVGPALIGATGV